MGDWPSREEWVERRRSTSYVNEQEISTAIGDYSTLEEIKALVAAMRERWKQLGKDARSLASDNQLYWQRKCINRGLKLLRHGELPLCLEDYSGAEDLLAPFHARHSAAEADVRKREKIEAAERPIDDAAWNTELERRAEIERYLGTIGRGEHIKPA